MSDRAARSVLILLAVVLAVLVLRLDLPTATGGQFWSDGSTYHAMAHSLAEDHDLRFEARDLYRIRREFPGGPQGVFLKRTNGGRGSTAAGASPGWPGAEARPRAASSSRRPSPIRWRPRPSCGPSARTASCS